jgi:hypothetical protein
VDGLFSEMDVTHPVFLTMLREHCGSAMAESCGRIGILLDTVKPNGEWPMPDDSEQPLAEIISGIQLSCNLGVQEACLHLQARVVWRQESLARFEEAARLAAVAAENERIRLAEELAEAERVRAIQERQSRIDEQRRRLLREVESGSRFDCRELTQVYSVDMPVCMALWDAIVDGRTSSDGREMIQGYLRGLGVSRLNGFIVARVDTGLYEAMRRTYDPYWDISYPRGQHFLLRTLLTEYTTRGNFRMWVTEVGTREITTTNGFVQTWNIYEESVLGQAWQEVRDASAGYQTQSAARTLLLALMGEL